MRNALVTVTYDNGDKEQFVLECESAADAVDQVETMANAIDELETSIDSEYERNFGYTIQLLDPVGDDPSGLISRKED